MTRFRPVLLAVLSAAVVASPVAAGVPYAWTFNGCGGTDFNTCISGGVYVSGTKIIVDITNIGPGVMTSVGLWNLPKVGRVTTLPTDADMVGDVGTPGAWNDPSNDINGVVSPAQRRYAVGTVNGINGGIATGGTASFWFDFGSGVDPATFVNSIGVGAHMQGLADCSSKVYLLSNGNGGSTESNTFQGSTKDCGLSVPEPGSLFLLGSGAAGMAFVASRRRKNLELIDEDGNDLAI